MATVQNTYTENISVGRAGQIATASPCIVDSYEVDATKGTGIKFGYAVKKGTNDDQVAVGVTGNASSPHHVEDFLGITVQDHARLGGTPTDAYDKGAIAACITQGDVWVPVEAAVTVGAAVTIDETTGQLSAATAADEQFLLPGARWMTAQATANGLAVVRLVGEIF